MTIAEYGVISHYPQPNRTEHVNIGIVVFFPDRIVRVHFGEDLKKLRAVDPSVDIESVRSWESGLPKMLAGMTAPEAKSFLQNFGQWCISKNLGRFSFSNEEEYLRRVANALHSLVNYQLNNPGRMSDNPVMSDAPSRQEVDAKLDTLRADVRADGASLRGDFEALRGDVKAEFASVRGEMRSEFSAVRGEMRSEFSAIRAEVHEGFAAQIKWIVGTAIGLGVAGITVMTFVLNNAAPKLQAGQPQAPVVIYMPSPIAPAAQAPTASSSSVK